jgi:FKBP-type peptidyl-prolyl cis-trans isomerase FkpA
MVSINKFEATWIFVSISVMALALAVIRFKTDILVLDNVDIMDNQATLVSVVTGDDTDNSEITRALTKSMSANGELVRLVIDDVKIGEGREVMDGSKVTAHYTGSTRDGVPFDSSYARGEPFTFTMGAHQVIKGWEEGLLGMKVGGQRILVIPPDMGYGDMQVGPIPPNTPLVFAIELIDVQ